jgi:hypothetical protein
MELLSGHFVMSVDSTSDILSSGGQTSDKFAFDQHLTASGMKSQNIFCNLFSWKHVQSSASYSLHPPEGDSLPYSAYAQSAPIPDFDYHLIQDKRGSWHSPVERVFITRLKATDPIYRDKNGIITRGDVIHGFKDTDVVIRITRDFRFELMNANKEVMGTLYAIPQRQTFFPHAGENTFSLVDAPTARDIMHHAGKTVLEIKNPKIKFTEPDLIKQAVFNEKKLSIKQQVDNAEELARQGISVGDFAYEKTSDDGSTVE